MAYPSPNDLRLLHTLRCIGASSVQQLAQRANLSEAETESQLIDFGVAGLVAHTPGPFGGWQITDQGRRIDTEFVTTELADTGCRAAVEAAYHRFLGLNTLALEACTAWQLRPLGGTTQINDHSDPRYDTRVLRQVASVERRGQEVCNDLGAVLERFEDYGPRLAVAVQRALAGEGQYVSEHPDSFHSLWFQLHEDLLLTLGITRADEQEP